NDYYGHMIGDKVIIEFSRLLLQMNDEHVFTARYGGDEFVTIITKFENEKTLEASIENKIKSIGSQIKVQNYTFDLTISVGVAIYPIHGQDIYSLIGKADSALGQIKLNGKNNIRFYQ
ncbi:MAG TPA: GGDEF domain-containing protein, partial [Acholeplasmataceae bacterium]|nr:GGDEF domain-containing protein [Acholeplasmataceae bacterium]